MSERLTDCAGEKERVAELKRQWLNDPCWDIEETEGFEQYQTELLIFRLQSQLDQANERLRKYDNFFSIARGLFCRE